MMLFMALQLTICGIKKPNLPSQIADEEIVH